METAPPAGIISLAGNQPVDATVEKLKSMLETNNVKLFAVVDHSGEAAKVGLEMRNTKLLIFGNPLQGTPLMLAAPSAALDLPLRILVAEDAEGRTRIFYHDPEYLIEHHQLPRELAGNIAGIAKIARKLAQ